MEKNAIMRTDDFKKLAGFGLVEVESGKPYSRQDRDGRIRVSALWDQFLKFNI